MSLLKTFIAGFVSVLIFHQGVIALLYFAGLTSRAPFVLTPTAPLGIPQVVSLAFWGGVWAIVLWPLIQRATSRSRYWLTAFVLGAVAPSLVAWFVVAPLKGQPMAGGGQMKILMAALLANGAWGLGVALLRQGMSPWRIDKAQ